MMTKKNLAKAVTLSLLLSTALSANAWALEINNGTIDVDAIVPGEDFSYLDFDYYNLFASSKGDKIILNNVNLTGDYGFCGFAGVSEINDGSMTGGGFIIGNSSIESCVGNEIDINGADITNWQVSGGYAEGDAFISNNKVDVKNSTLNEAAIFGGYDDSYFEGKNHNNIVCLDNVTVNVGAIYGGYLGETIGNGIIIKNSTFSDDTLIFAAYAGYLLAEKDNYVTIVGENELSNTEIKGYIIGESHENNKLNLDGFNDKIGQLDNFDIINFKNLDLNKDKVVTVNKSEGGLENTKIDIISFAGGQNFEVGKTVDLLKVEDKDSWNKAFTNLNKQTTTDVGLSRIVTSDIGKDEATQTLTATVAKIERNQQTDLVASNRAVAAAFVNQGTDLIADSLDTLSRDGKYGVKTFAAVHGNRSKYDVNSDIKINGWSTIVGVGSETEHNGGDFSWGVFYENGSGNYRTFNSFNNEYFRGDGSLVYNGGGIAARYENAHGVYTEGSLRAGMLKSDMDNALSDGENKYGYSSESEYYGAHIGIGQIIPLSESSDLDVYGKFFHTYTEGDSFKVDTDEFEFDSINSDRLRVGARLTTNKENKFSTYYGLAYEYEFNGDAEMRAAGMSAPTQSLQGSSYMAEVGFNYQPTPESPWSFDLNLRGYAGEREGATFNVQATYTF